MGCKTYKQDTHLSSIATLNRVVEPRQRYITIREPYGDGNGCQCLTDRDNDRTVFQVLPYTVFIISIFEQLFENGFVRSANHFEKYKSNDCCCSGYNSRVDVLRSTPTHKQEKIINHFSQVIEQIFNGTFQEELTNLKKQEQEQPPASKLQKIRPLSEWHKAINQDSNPEIKVILTEIQYRLLQCKMQLTQENFETHEYNFQINDPNNIKIFFHSQTDSYYTNHNIYLLHQNKSLQKEMNYDQKQFNILLGQQLKGKCILENKFMLQLNKNGYLNIIRQNLQKKAKIEKKVKLLALVKEPKKKNVIFQDLIDQKSFTFEEFYVGKMKINLKRANCTVEVLSLYQDYMLKVHERRVNEKYFLKNYIVNVLEQNEYLEDKQKKKRLQLGQSFMEYRINNILIGIGVIILTTKHLISEYLFYKPNLKKESFGIFAALVEINYVKQIQKVFPQFQYQSLSFILCLTRPMSYKIKFNALEVQCCNTYEWFQYNNKIMKKMKANKSQLSEKQPATLPFDANCCTFYIHLKYQTYEQLNEFMRGQVYSEMAEIETFIGPQLMRALIFEISG